MGMFREAGSCEIDIIKEMAEGLGSTGLKLEDILEKLEATRGEVLRRVHMRDSGHQGLDEINESIGNYNKLVGQAEDALRWLLIQREACGFRTHRNVDAFYPIPPRMKLLK